jgi:hypothetical protein
LKECPKNVKFDTDEDQFLRGSSVASNYKEMEAAEEGNAEGIGADQQQGQPDETDRASMRSPAPSEMSQQSKSTRLFLFVLFILYLYLLQVRLERRHPILQPIRCLQTGKAAYVRNSAGSTADRPPSSFF